MRMPEELFKKYEADPLKTDGEVRKILKIPDNKYYMVTIWPDKFAGEVRIDTKSHRDSSTPKISKSDSQ